MRISYAVEMINPDHSVDLSGYGYYLDRVTDEVQEDIAVHACLLQQESMRILIVNCDLLGLSAYIVQQTKQQVFQYTGIPPENIVLFATHTHTAPTVIPLIGCGVLDYQYQDQVIEAIVRVARKVSEKNWKVDSIRRLQYLSEPIGYNRTIPGGPEDHNVYGLVFYAEGCAPYVLFNYSCHPVTLGPKKIISSDYPYYVLQELNAKGYCGMFINGCNGDIDPLSNQVEWGSGTQQTISEYGKQLTRNFWKALENSVVEDDSILTIQNCTFELPVREVKWQEIPLLSKRFKELSQGDRAMERAVDEWEAHIRDFYVRGLLRAESRVDAQLVGIGNCILLALPGELYTELGQRIRKCVQQHFLLIGSNANTAMRYVPSPGEIEAETYGGFVSSIPDGALPVDAKAMDLYVKEITRCLLEQR